MFGSSRVEEEERKQHYHHCRSRALVSGVDRVLNLELHVFHERATSEEVKCEDVEQSHLENTAMHRSRATIVEWICERLVFSSERLLTPVSDILGCTCIHEGRLFD